MIGLLWTALGSGTVFLMIKAFSEKEKAVCTGIEIEIQGASANLFVDKQDIIAIVKKYATENVVGKPIKNFKLQKMESELQKDVWLNKAVIYFDNKGILKVQIHEREPLARIFTIDGKSFYIDESIKILPLSNKHTARLPVFTNYPVLGTKPTKSDTALLSSISKMSAYIYKDTFLMSMIDQVDINKNKNFELVPKLGDQLILFGDTTDLVNKFEKFKLFYSKVIPVYGWNKYNKINLQFKNQVVASIRGKEDVIADSLRTLQIMKTLAEYSSKMAADTSKNYSQHNEISDPDITMILQSMPREDNDYADTLIKINPMPAKAPVVVNATPQVKLDKTNNQTISTNNKNKQNKKP